VSLKVKTSLEGYIKDKKNELEDLLKEYRGMFREPKVIPPKREVELKFNYCYTPPC